MKSVKILFNQTLLDIAVQELGDYSRAVELAVLNGMKLTDMPVAGSFVQVPTYERDKSYLVTLFSDDANKPATGDTGIENAVLQGIGYWRIEQNFRVS
jgi:hypothetical protein